MSARACEACLRRAWLVGSLAARIEAALGGRRGRDTRALLGLPDSELAAAVAGSEGAAFAANARRRQGARLLEAVRGAGCWVICAHEAGYPERLRSLPDAPAVLFGRGDAGLLGVEPLVTVVGARRASAYGRELAQGLGHGLASAGVPVVSGMALGIDSRAHLGALEGGGATIAVLGGGAEAPSPAAMRRLYERIVAGGLVISELPPGTSPRRWTFPARNRIMAALGAMTVVVEARHGSGSLITATMATDLGREVGAVPGQVGVPVADGTNALLRDGAQLVRDAGDVLDALLGPGAHGVRQRGASAPDLAPELRAVLEQVELGSGSPDAVSLACGLDAGAAGAALARLELAGLVRADATGRYRVAGR